jgi:predicted negative regulator of RcsB-dependent stress response
MAENDDTVEKEKVDTNLMAEFGEEEEQDVLLQIRMGVYDFVIRNGRNILYSIGTFLFLVLIYGLWQGYQRDIQRDGHEAIFEVTMKAPKISDRALQGFAALDNPNDLNRMQKLRELASEMETVAANNTGFAKASAYLEAATLWKRSGETESERAALKLAIENADNELMKWAATSRIAYSQVNDDQLEDAVTTLSEYSSQRTDYYGEIALLSAVEIEIQRENTTGAETLLSQYQTKYPAGTLTNRVAVLRMQMGLPEIEIAEVPAPEEQ